MNARKVYSPAFLVPMLILYTALFIVPTLVGFGYSFTNWNSMSDVVKWVGLKNYREIFSPGSNYAQSLITTFWFTLSTVLFKGGLGLALALMLHENIKSKDALRGVFFLPNTLSPLIIGILFASILAPKGVFNDFLRFIGLGRLAKGWLTRPDTALGAVVSVECWRMIGWNMVMLLAGLQSIPKDYFEASSIDGASWWGQFRHITLPCLAPSLTIVTVLNTIHGIKSFDIVFALTGGGPGAVTEVINVLVFREFSMGRYGMSTALGIVLFAVTAVIALFIKRTMSGGEEA